MSINDMMTTLMDKGRTNYHTTDKLSITDLTTLMDKPGIDGPLGFACPDWVHVSGWGTKNDVNFTVPVYPDVPVYATVEIKNITATIENQGAELGVNFVDKHGKSLSYWDKDSNGNYKPSWEGINMIGDNFSNKNGVRTGFRVFDQNTIANIAYLRVGLANDVETAYDVRNLIVSYYKPYTYADIMGG